MAVTEFLIATVVILIIYLIRSYQKLKDDKIEKFLQKFPSPPGVPILGNALDFRTSTNFLTSLSRYIKDFGSMVAFRVGPFKKILLVTDYNITEWLLSSPNMLTKTNNYRFFIPWIGDGILTSTGDVWRTHRKLITPAFHFKILEQFCEVFEKEGDILIKNLREKSGAPSFDIAHYSTLLTLDTICETAMGVPMNIQSNQNSDYLQSVKEMCEVFTERSISPIASNDFLMLFTSTYWKQRRAVKVLHGHRQKIMDKKIAELKNKRKEELVEENNDDTGVKNRKGLLDLLLTSTLNGKPVPNHIIIQDVDGLTFAGHDTTAMGLTFCLYEIANHPDVQEKILEEQRALFGDNPNPKVTLSDLQEMKYLEAVIKESMRLYPPIPYIGRKMTEDVEYNGMILPKDLNIVIFIVGIHMNPKHFPEPEKFDPTRFTNPDNRVPPYAYIPFSAGPRNCIGQKFGLYEMKSVISKVVRNYELLPSEPEHTLELCTEVVLKSKTGAKLRLRARTAHQNGFIK